MKTMYRVLAVLLCVLLTALPLGAMAGSWATNISSVMSSFTLNNYSCDSAP